jgi:hypothetical protein
MAAVTRSALTQELVMSEPTGGLPSGADPSDPGTANDSSLGADRPAAIEAEKQRWRNKLAKQEKAKDTEKNGADSGS